MDEKRNFSRINFTASTQVEFNDNVYEGELLDLSLRGALLSLKDQVPLKLNDRCVIRISLHSSDIKLVFDSELTHINKNNLGFKFLGEDVETMTHLRNLLSLNVGDYDKITDELDFLLKE
ncbi:MAG: PilZ domain-containing protein [Candidatus Scalindua sp.]